MGRGNALTQHMCPMEGENLVRLLFLITTAHAIAFSQLLGDILHLYHDLLLIAPAGTMAHEDLRRIILTRNSKIGDCETRDDNCTVKQPFHSFSLYLS